VTDERAAVGVDAALAIASAAIIAWGVVALGWSPFIVMMLFWFENVVIGVFNLAKMLVTGVRLGPAGVVGALAVGAFFTVHYGMFTAIHGVFVVMLFGSAELGRGAMDGGLFAPVGAMLHYLLAERVGWLAAIGIVLVHASLFVQWSMRTRELPTALKELMGAPYGRIVVLHVTLIASGFLVQALQAPVAGALLLIGLKLAYDLVTLSRERRTEPDADAQLRVQRLLVVGRRNLDGRP
jgi:hypothetical protein